MRGLKKIKVKHVFDANLSCPLLFGALFLLIDVVGAEYKWIEWLGIL